MEHIIKKSVIVFIVAATALMACHQPVGFSYKKIEGDSAITPLPFSKNYDLAIKGNNPIVFAVRGDTVYTSVYFVAHAGCPGTAIIPVIEKNRQQLILSYKIKKRVFSDYCEVTQIQLNFAIRNENYKAVYFRFPEHVGDMH